MSSPNPIARLRVEQIITLDCAAVREAIHNYVRLARPELTPLRNNVHMEIVLSKAGDSIDGSDAPCIRIVREEP